ncbi:hypothetical protein PENTCL1PPCAC_28776, partial [Pristionchus entomophagus]
STGTVVSSRESHPLPRLQMTRSRPNRRDRSPSLIIFLSLLVHGILGQQSDVFLKQPSSSPYYVREGEEGPTLECTLAPGYRGDNHEVQWIRYTKGLPRTLTRNSKLLEKAHFELVNDAPAGQHDLKIKHITRADTSGTYHCLVLNTEDGTQYTTDGSEVIVLVPPGDPKIVSAPTETVTEGEGISFKCSSSGGSPTPSFQWYFHNSTLAPSELHSQQIHGDAVDSTIHWRASPEDNGAYVTCAVSNFALQDGEEKKTKSPRLNVLYRPRVSVGPVSEYAVEAGQMIQLTCAADANPSQPSFQWTHLASAKPYASPTWPFVAEKGMGGAYECRVRNTVGEAAATMTVQVQFAPVVTVTEIVNPAEGESVEVECTVDAVPTTSSIEWTGPNGFVITGDKLILSSVTREQSGNYTCTATNYLNLYGESGSQPRIGRAVTFVDVKRRPGRGVIAPWTLSVVVGGTIELACEATDVGSPAAQFKWASPSSGGQYGTKEHTRQALVIRNAQLADNGEYRCIPHNAMGEGEPGIARVIVIEPATIERPMATERIYGEGEKDQELSCEARGYPAPHITWLKDEQPIAGDAWKVETLEGHSSCSPTDFCSVSVTSTLRWARPVEWSDKGNYSCVASNGALESSSTWTLARVTHGPVILNDRFPTEALAAADIAATAMISCRVSARPEPTFEWLYDSKEIIEGGRYSFQLNREVGKPDEYESVLYVSEVQEQDYGRYLCRSMNGKGENAEVVIRMKEKSVPSPSDDLDRLSSGPNWMSLSWRPGFDGGSPQSFSLEYRMLNPFTESVANAEVLTVDVTNSTLRSFTKSSADSSRATRATQSMFATNFMTYNLTGLKPLSTYYVRIRSQNRMGVSEFTKILIATTEDVAVRKELITPSNLNYIVSEGAFSVQPATPADHCLMFYVQSGDVWRAVGCFNSNRTTSLDEGGDAFKARFCTMTSDGEHVVECSDESRVLVASMLSPPYRFAILVPIAVLSFVILLLCAFLIICCRIKSPTKTTKTPLGVSVKGSKSKKKSLSHERPEVSGPLSSPGSKNAPKNGSATDSGVFTLDSTRLEAGAQKSPGKSSGSSRSANYSSHEAGVDVWPSAGDEGYHGYHGEAFLADASYPVNHGTYYDGANGHAPHDSASYEEQEEEEGYPSGGRRVLREIIV